MSPHYVGITPPPHLVFWSDVGAAMDPAVVLGHVGADALELAAKEKVRCDKIYSLNKLSSLAFVWV